MTYTRLVEGGSPALGEGESKGYLEITDDLAVKVWAVSHGHCYERHSHRGSGSVTRPGSFDGASMGASPMGVMSPPMSHLGPRGLAHHNSISAANNSLAAFIQQQQQRDQDRMSIHQGNLFGGGGRNNSISGLGPTHGIDESVCVYDSSAYFIRDVNTGREIIIFGDVEPDSVSLSPRNRNIWREAAPKIASGKLTAIFIECSFDDSQTDDRLFGHLTPRYIVEEMTALAEEVTAARMDILRRQYEKEHGIKRQQSTARPGPMGRSYSDFASVSSDKKRKRAEEEDRNTRRRTITSHSRAASANPGFRTRREAPTSGGPVADKNQQQSQGRSSQPQQDGRHPAEDSISPKSGKRYENRLSSASAQAAAAAASTTSLHDNDGVNPRNPTGFVIDTPHLATPTAEMSLDDFQQRATVNHQPQFNTSLQQHQMGGVTSGNRADLPQFHLSEPTSPYGSPSSNAMSISTLPPPAAPAAVHFSQLNHPSANLSSSSNSGSGLQSSTSNVTPATSMSLYLNGATQDMMDTDSNADVDINVELARRLPEMPLEGLKVVIIHVKDRMVDGPTAGEVIMEQLQEHEEEVQLGVEWVMSFAGQEVFV